MVVTTKSPASTSFNADGLSVVDAYFGVDSANKDNVTLNANADARPSSQNKVPNQVGMKDLLKSSLKRSRQDQENGVNDESDRLNSGSEEEEEGRTYISKSKASRQTTGRRGDHNVITEESHQEINAIKETGKSYSMTKIVDGSKKDVAPVTESPKSFVTDPLTPPPENRHRRKKSRSRQKNIRKDNRDVKPSFTRNPTAPGYRPLTVETKEYLRHKNNLRKSLPSNSIIAELNNPERS